MKVQTVARFNQRPRAISDRKPWIALDDLLAQQRPLARFPERCRVGDPVAKSRHQVEAFYRAALEAGGRDNGPPGLRPQYSGKYYAAFVIGPDGHNIEAVYHEPEA